MHVYLYSKNDKDNPLCEMQSDAVPRIGDMVTTNSPTAVGKVDSVPNVL